MRGMRWYRQFQGLDVTTGYIGSSQSEDGEEWFTEQTLNQRYPTGEEEPNLPTATGTPQGRYPSAGFAPGGNPTAIWNEYTNVGPRWRAIWWFSHYILTT